jgi:hypothetical protein
LVYIPAENRYTALGLSLPDKTYKMILPNGRDSLHLILGNGVGYEIDSSGTQKDSFMHDHTEGCAISSYI